MSAGRKKHAASAVGKTLALGGLLGLGCAATQLGATPAELSQARTQAGAGADVFAHACARCHGQRGEGIGNAPAILGPGSLPEQPRSSSGASGSALTDPQLLQIEAQARPAGAAWRDPFRTAQDLYDFTSTHMPRGNAGALKPADYWAVVSFMLAAQGATLPSGGVGPGTAGAFQIPRR